MNIDNLCNQFQYMCNEQYCEEDLDCEGNKPIYFAGIYGIWKENNPIYINYFIYENFEADTEYKADKKLWEKHKNDFHKNHFSELNQSIENINDIEIHIIDSHLFEEETYNDIKNLMDDELQNYQESHIKEGNNVIKKRKDVYNMTDLLESLEYCLEMDELFGEEDE